jgi:hypothetical protein
MYQGLLHLHSTFRWVILLLLVAVIVQALLKKEVIQKTSLFLLIASHLTLLIGLYQYFTGDLGFNLIVQAESFGGVMKNSVSRFWAFEHITAMLLAIVLITIARRSAKNLIYKKAFLLYVIALVLILAAVPWPFREGVSRPWFPGM